VRKLVAIVVGLGILAVGVHLLFFTSALWYLMTPAGLKMLALDALLALAFWLVIAVVLLVSRGPRLPQKTPEQAVTALLQAGAPRPSSKGSPAFWLKVKPIARSVRPDRVEYIRRSVRLDCIEHIWQGSLPSLSFGFKGWTN
jgi:hypothetical protein